MSGGYGHVYSTVRKEIADMIAERLADKSANDYLWSRAAASDEASYAVMAWLEGEGLL